MVPGLAGGDLGSGTNCARFAIVFTKPQRDLIIAGARLNRGRAAPNRAVSFWGFPCPIDEFDITPIKNSRLKTTHAMTQNSIETPWKTYLKAAISTAPALFLWGVAAVFCFPKIKQIWRDTGFAGPGPSPDSFVASSIQLMRTSGFLLENGVAIVAGIIVALVLLEWQSPGWPRYRRPVVWIASFLLTTGVLVLLTTMLISLLMVVPAMLQMK
jgi:hypothetical protein